MVESLLGGQLRHYAELLQHPERVPQAPGSRILPPWMRWNVMPVTFTVRFVAGIPIREADCVPPAVHRVTTTSSRATCSSTDQ